MTKSMPPIKDVPLEEYGADKDNQNKFTNKQTTEESTESNADNQLTKELARAKMSTET